MQRRLIHIKQADASADRAIREIVEALNDVLERMAPPSASVGADSDKGDIQAVSVKRNLYSLAVRSKDGMLRSFPGLFHKTDKGMPAADEGEIFIARADGTFLPGTIVAGANTTVDYANGIITIGNSGVAGSGITTLNALNPVTQLLAVGTAGTDFAISSAVATHTFNLPTASASARGALSSSDWSLFNGKGTYRSKSEALAANTSTPITYSSVLTGTVQCVALSCKDADGAEVEVTISAVTTSGFTAICPVAATLIYLAVPEV